MAVDRIIDGFPEARQNQVRLQLSDVLRTVVSQRLVEALPPGGRLPAQTWKQYMTFAHQGIELKPIPMIADPMEADSKQPTATASGTPMKEANALSKRATSSPSHRSPRTRSRAARR